MDIILPFRGSINRSNRKEQALNDMISNMQLTNKNTDILFTHTSKIHGTYSHLDYVFVLENLTTSNRINCTPTTIIDTDITNFSSHRPLHVEIHCDIKYKSPTKTKIYDKTSPFDLPTRINWKQGNTEEYRITLVECLGKIDTTNINSKDINEIILKYEQCFLEAQRCCFELSNNPYIIQKKMYIS